MKKEVHERECMLFSVKMFRVVGCWPNWKQKRKLSEQLYYCYTAIICFVLFVYAVILAYGLAINYSTWSSLEEALEELLVFATGFIVFLKLILYLWKQNELQEMINYINDDLNIRQLKDDEDIAVMKSCVKHEKSLTKTYVFCGYCITVLYTTSSILKIINERMSDADHQTLPLKYPFRPKNFLMYHLLYFHQMVVMILNGHIGTLADTFFSCLAYYICGHFGIIKNRIAKEGGVITRDFVSYHNEIIRLVENLQSVFGFFLMFQLSTNSLLICLGVLQITQTTNINVLHYIKCLIYVTIKLMQMFLYCWYGEEVLQRSLSVALGAYSGTWHDTKNRAMIANFKMVLFRSQIPVKIKAGNHFLVSLPMLAKVMNAAYSFFTVIKSSQK